jgi:hypothetical protein
VGCTQNISTGLSNKIDASVSQQRQTMQRNNIGATAKSGTAKQPKSCRVKRRSGDRSDRGCIGARSTADNNQANDGRVCSTSRCDPHILQATMGGKALSENVTVAEVLALKAIVRVLLAEKIREFKDEASATFELAANCSEIVNDAQVSGPDPEGTKQVALRHLDNIFGSLKRTR